MPDAAHSSLITLLLGAVILLTAWLPLVVRRLPLSLPIVAVAAGYLLLPVAWVRQETATAIEGGVLEHATEFIILIALMGAGLRVERDFSWRTWQAPIRLLGVALPLTIIGMTLLCHFLLGLSWPAAFLISAALSPTDPVLAADVQLNPPEREEGGETRFGLTTEAGLNDGLAFPFILLAMTLTETPPSSPWAHWIFVDLLWKVGCGGLIGYVAGKAFGWLTFRLPRLKLSRTGDGLVAVGVTLISYGVAELAHGNGFVAVFVAAVTLRSADPSARFHTAMAEFSEQIERVLMVLLLLVLGGAIAAGILQPIGWVEVMVGLALLFLIRPLAGWVSLLGSPLPAASRALMAFFGIRGLATFYYLAYATTRADFTDTNRLWAIGSFVVLVSVIVHGVTSTPAMDWVDRRRAARGLDDGRERPGGRDR
jgi:NhaP-type Na+/H+ or K+/H+ antiporter